MGGRILQRHVLYLGELNGSQEASWRRTVELFSQDQSAPEQVTLFPEDHLPQSQDSPIPSVGIRLSHMRLVSPRQWGACWLGKPVLQYDNIDCAELYGYELVGGWQINDEFALDGSVSHVRGRNKDTVDDLYRTAPLRGMFDLSYRRDSWEKSSQMGLGGRSEPGLGSPGRGEQFRLRHSQPAPCQNLLRIRARKGRR